jgi:hypothetical protein
VSGSGRAQDGDLGLRLDRGPFLFMSPASNDSTNYDICPIPKTHRRLAEAHLLWHQSLDQYHNPEAFRANLNSTIQALRNITWVLQSEKRMIPDFDNWYASWQEKLRSSPLCRWLIDARNTVVKQGELNTHSTALVKLLTWRDEKLMESEFPPEIPSSLIFRNPSVVELINKAGLPPADRKGAVIEVERRWSASDLNGREILDALAEIYGILSELVLDAHVKVAKLDCVPPNQPHVHFHSAHSRTGNSRVHVDGYRASIRAIRA